MKPCLAIRIQRRRLGTTRSSAPDGRRARAPSNLGECMPGGVLVVGNSGNRRVHLFAEAARGAGFDVRVAPWIEVIARPEVLVDDATDEPRLVRIDAWGEDTEVERALLRRQRCERESDLASSSFPAPRTMP